MKGYLMQRQTIVRGQDTFIESFSPENNFGVVFEDDGETAYFYALEKDPASQEQRVLDALHIYETEEGMEEKQFSLFMIWSKDWLKCALVIDGICNALFDFENQGGYNLNEFPPPNGIWTRGGRELVKEVIDAAFPA